MRPKILISNDDGYFSEGIQALYETLMRVGEVTVVAPDTERSGASNSLTLDRPLKVRQAANGFYYINGTPTDCVHMAVTGLLVDLPDLIVSGVNHGSNMGDDTLYSGTVAAATEGFLLGIPALAVSSEARSGQALWEAAEQASLLVRQLLVRPLPSPILINMNVPDCAKIDMKGFKVTRLGRRHKAEPVIPAKNPRGETIYWVGAAGQEADAGPGTDFDAVKNKWISLTPLQIDLTHHAQLEQLANWIKPL